MIYPKRFEWETESEKKSEKKEEIEQFTIFRVNCAKCYSDVQPRLTQSLETPKYSNCSVFRFLWFTPRVGPRLNIGY